MSYRDWLVTKLNDHEEHPDIDSAIALGNSFIEIHTTKGKTVIVGAIDSNSNITSQDVYEVYKNGVPKPNIVIAKYGAIWDGGAIDYLRQQNIGWGGMGEILSAFQTDCYADIQKREYNFVEEGLLKHSRVIRLERIYDRVFKIHRKSGLPPFTITLINSYELSGEEVRHAIKTYGKFNAVLKTNPNGSPTGQAYSAAAEIGADIFIFRELLGRLNRR